MTTPNSGSGAQSGTGNSLLDQAGIVAPTTSGAAGGSKYGLGTLASIPVTVGGLFPVNSADGTMSAEQVMEQLAHADPATIAQLQAYLYKGGFYGSGVRWADINLGVIRPDDLDAMKGAVSVAAQTGADLTDYVRRQAAWGVYTGAVSLNGAGRGGRSGSSSASGGVLTIEKPDPKRIGAIVDEEFKKLLGHKPSAHERAGFIAAYTNAYEQQKKIDDYNAQVAATTGGGTGAGPVSGSSAPPVLLPTDSKQKLPGSPFGILAHAGDILGGMLQHQNFVGYLRHGLPEAQAEAGVVPSEVSAQNAQTNTRNINADNSFLALADKPLPGMPGYSSGSGSSASSTTTVVQQQAYDPQAFADEWIQQHHTAESGAHSVTDVFSNFLNILQGGMK